MRFINWLLTPVGPRWSLKRKNRYRGAALLMVLVGIMLMTSLVQDLSHQELVRYRLATYQRDALKAEALAEGGIQFARLLVTMQAKVQPLLLKLVNSGVPLPSLMLWELVPLNSGTLQTLAEGTILNSLGLDVAESIEKRKTGSLLEDEKKEVEEEDKKKKKNKNTKKEEGLGAFKKPDAGFGAFDGTFDLEMEDEESKISLRAWMYATDQEPKVATKGLLMALIEPDRYDPLFTGTIDKPAVDRATLVGNIYDWATYSDQRVDMQAPESEFGKRFYGSKLEVYSDLEGITPKNAYYDSLQELKLIKGFDESLFKNLAKAITIYGEGGKINLLSMKDQVVESVLRYCVNNKEDLLLKTPGFIEKVQKSWKQYRTSGGGPLKPEGFVSFLTGLGLKVDSKRCQAVLGVKSGNFIIQSKAIIGDVTKTLSLVVRLQNGVEEFYYFRSY